MPIYVIDTSIIAIKGKESGVGLRRAGLFERYCRTSKRTCYLIRFQSEIHVVVKISNATWLMNRRGTFQVSKTDPNVRRGVGYARRISN
jgi:hypothetical protein